ncbi:divalent-cation tolerance protein CutA [Kitasatospora sp. NPDC056783]|uniref:divalent-cation tolerance protein CutA n=1 Tax=Kitasatospora sp. NPDC056783 TaxID=3345943 RepID=UPI0036D19F97
MSDFLVVTTTHDDETKARELAAKVIGARLAACAQVYPIRSVYWWEGEVQSGEEWRIDFKTRAELAEPLGTCIAEQHSYDVPEVVAVPVVTGAESCLNWITAETSAG